MKQSRIMGASEPIGQRGSTLIVALVMLLLLSLISVASMKDTILQERMTSNAEARGMGFEAAEGALREGENDVDDDASGGLDHINPLGDWSSFITNQAQILDPRAAGNPKYHLSPPRCPELAEGGCPVEIFDVSARGVGERDNTITILRTAYGRVN